MSPFLRALVLFLSSLAVLPVRARAADPGPCSAWRDEGSDGRVDTRTEYLYEGRLLVTELTFAAHGGRPLSVTEYVYDRSGRLWGKAVDRNDDGKSDLHVYLTYDARGRLASEALDEAADGRFDRFVSYTYQGPHRWASIDLNADGSIDRRDLLTAKTVDGNVVSETLDYGADRHVDRVASYIYDAADNRVYELVDEGADGSTDAVIGYLYECW